MLPTLCMICTTKSHTDALRISRKTALERDRIAFDERATTGDESTAFEFNKSYVHKHMRFKIGFY